MLSFVKSSIVLFIALTAVPALEAAATGHHHHGHQSSSAAPATPGGAVLVANTTLFNRCRLTSIILNPVLNIQHPDLFTVDHRIGRQLHDKTACS